MAAEYDQAPQELLDIAEELIQAHHSPLGECRVGFLLRLDEPTSGGRRVVGKAKKIGPELKEFMDLDFLIWVSADFWELADYRQKCALVDHELCHCEYDGEKFRVRRHDLEEFACVIERWGLWEPGIERFAEAIQPHLLREEDMGNGRGAVLAVDPGSWDRALEGETN